MFPIADNKTKDATTRVLGWCTTTKESVWRKCISMRNVFYAKEMYLPCCCILDLFLKSINAFFYLMIFNSLLKYICMFESTDPKILAISV